MGRVEFILCSVKQKNFTSFKRILRIYVEYEMMVRFCRKGGYWHGRCRGLVQGCKEGSYC